jgi:hypothetical protein
VLFSVPISFPRRLAMRRTIGYWWPYKEPEFWSAWLYVRPHALVV